MPDMFEQKLAEFQQYANGVHPEFGRLVADAIATSYVSRLGDTTPQTGVVDKIGSVLDAVSGTYLKTMEAYYGAKARLAELKAQADAAKYGTLYTQGVNAVQSANPPWLIWAAIGLGAIFLFRR